MGRLSWISDSIREFFRKGDLLLLFLCLAASGYGLALILFAIIVKTILFPVTLQGKKSMIKTTMLSGKMQQLQKQLLSLTGQNTKAVQWL